jgi:hypothetical protein
MPSGGVSTGAPPLPGAPPAPGDLDPEVTRTRLAEFLHRHTAYELIPESAKVPPVLPLTHAEPPAPYTRRVPCGSSPHPSIPANQPPGRRKP